MEKELKRHRRELEKRTQEAGSENMIKDGLPVYYLEQGEIDEIRIILSFLES